MLDSEHAQPLFELPPVELVSVFEPLAPLNDAPEEALSVPLVAPLELVDVPEAAVLPEVPALATLPLPCAEPLLPVAASPLAAPLAPPLEPIEESLPPPSSGSTPP